MLAALAWAQYGHPKRIEDKGKDSELERFIPDYEVTERHRITVNAPAEIAFSAACDLNLESCTIVRALFRARELLLGSTSARKKALPIGLVDQAKLWGWGILSEDPGRKIIFGAVTQPWLARPAFRALSPADFPAFHEPGYAKIAWTLQVRPADATTSTACTETRVVTTDPVSRTKFRHYWAFARPGIVLIRWVALRLVKQAAEVRAKSL